MATGINSATSANRTPEQKTSPQVQTSSRPTRPVRPIGGFFGDFESEDNLTNGMVTGNVQIEMPSEAVPENVLVFSEQTSLSFTAVSTAEQPKPRQETVTGEPKDNAAFSFVGDFIPRFSMPIPSAAETTANTFSTIGQATSETINVGWNLIKEVARGVPGGGGEKAAVELDPEKQQKKAEDQARTQQGRAVIAEEAKKAAFYKVHEKPIEDKRIYINSLNGLQKLFIGSVDERGNAREYYQTGADSKESEDRAEQVKAARQKSLQTATKTGSKMAIDFEAMGEGGTGRGRSNTTNTGGGGAG